MPEFEMVPILEARLRTASGRRGQIVKEYGEYIRRLGENQAGKLQAGEGEKITTIRRRLTTTAELLGQDLVVKRVGEELYFWAASAEEPRPGRRRRRTQEQTG